MRGLFGRETRVGYCTNVHAGPTYERMRANLERHALAVKARVSPAEPMGVGLWLARPAAAEMLESGEAERFRAWLEDRGLVPFTLNAFPYDDFHRRSVKHRVYEPDWTTDERTRYTLDLIDLHATLLGDEPEGSISTLPIGWRAAIAGRDGAVQRAAANLLQVVDHLAGVEQRTGKLIHVDLEPEPGCYLDTSRDVVEFFQAHLFGASDPRRVARYLRVCHDICHAAVMFEPQAQAVRNYRDAGIRIGKVQLSAAVRAPFDRCDDSRREETLDQLQRFDEQRYLHQTTVRAPASGESIDLYEDLPRAIEAARTGDLLRREWRVHFHVPLFVERFGLLETTSDEVVKFLALGAALEGIRHFEAETYAWEVLPDDLQTGELADGIARELSWLRDLAAQRPTA